MKAKTRKTIAAAVTAAAITAAALTISGCAYTESVMKDLESDTYKLDRTVELYDYNGQLIRSWEGEMRIESESSQSCSFIINDKRTTINGGIIVTQEK